MSRKEAIRAIQREWAEFFGDYYLTLARIYAQQDQAATRREVVLPGDAAIQIALIGMRMEWQR